MTLDEVERERTPHAATSARQPSQREGRAVLESTFPPNISGLVVSSAESLDDQRVVDGIVFEFRTGMAWRRCPFSASEASTLKEAQRWAVVEEQSTVP